MSDFRVFMPKTLTFLARCVVLALPLACGLNDDTVLETTKPRPGAGGATTGGSAGIGGTGGVAGAEPASPCALMWGRSWRGRSDEVLATGNPAYPAGLDMVGIWIGYEEDNKLNGAIVRMLRALLPGGDESLQGIVPVFYGYLIPFKSRADGLGDCAPNATTPNFCTTGAAWIREHLSELRTIYASYAAQIRAIWGTERPLVWLFEPDFSDYVRESQSVPFSYEELGQLATELIRPIKDELPNAIVSHFMSSEISDYSAYFEHFDLSLVGLVNVTGSANYEYFKSQKSALNSSATYRSLHEATGLPIFVDTGFGASTIADNGWLTAGADVVNARIADGVVAVLMDQGVDLMQERIDTEQSLAAPVECILR